MKVYSVVALFSLAAICVLADPLVYYDLNDAPQLFHKFIKKFGREYKDYNEYLIRYQAFVKSLIRSNKSNAEDDLATYGITELSDYTEEETKSQYGYLPVPPSVVG
ncbi:cysteine proteinase 1-like [Ostrinia furnacalis]|uniref:cysteine proteinase 1-like n=1 Tax=Ostrinia furnacalis TaxID=93504 RepID=UPI001040059A|nr:cysteine proteinase 1-like [Ostrinia furnacalis]